MLNREITQEPLLQKKEDKYDDMGFNAILLQS